MSLYDAQQKKKEKKQKNHPRLCHFLPPNYSDFADFPQYFFLESLTTAADCALAQLERASALVAKVLPCFKEFVTVHEIIILLQGQVNCVLHKLFSSFKTLLLISWISEAELSAKVQKKTSLLLPTHTTSLPVTSSLKGQHGQSPTPAKHPSLLSNVSVPFPDFGARLVNERQKQTHCGTAAK